MTELQENLLLGNKKNFDFVFFLLIVLLLFYFYINLTTFIVGVDGDSMNNTLVDGDVVIVTKTKNVNRGDIVVFDTDHGKLIKRVIALEGDTLYCDEKGCVYLKKQGETEFRKLDEIYAKGITENLNQTTILKNEIFVLGDNRAFSQDSRYFGAVKLSSVNGVVTASSVKDKKVSTFMFGWIFKIGDFLS